VNDKGFHFVIEDSHTTIPSTFRQPAGDRSSDTEGAHQQDEFRPWMALRDAGMAALTPAKDRPVKQWASCFETRRMMG
jgi:hypothetical protein